MEASASADLPVMGLGSEVPLAAVARSLRQLWESNEAVTRASAMNFAICSEDPDSLAANTELIREVTREHACRAILLAVRHHEGPGEVRAWITAHCQVAAGGRKSVCSEQIAFLVSGSSPQLLPSTLFAHVDSDLPLTFWWQGHFSPRWEPHLYAEIDRLVIDSSAWADPLREFAVLEESWRSANRGFSVNDLSWTRVLPYRMAVAASFDDPETLAALPRMDVLEITHGPGHGLAARMLAAWVCERAGWSVTGGDAAAGFALSDGGRPVSLRFRQCPHGCAIAKVEMSASDLAVTLQRTPGSAFIEGAAESGGQRRHATLTPCACDAPADLVKERLRRGCNTRHYFALLETVRQFLV